jgi:Ner family transcriptional regulator
MKQPRPRKTAIDTTQFLTETGDWHSAAIIARLRVAGWSLRGLAVHHGYVSGQLGAAMSRPWPKGERLIAAAIGVAPETIWPSRYAKRAERHARLAASPYRSSPRPRPAPELDTGDDGHA